MPTKSDESELQRIAYNLIAMSQGGATEAAPPTASRPPRSKRRTGRAGGRPLKFTAEQAIAMLAMYDAEEKTVDEIAAIFGTSRRTVYDYLARRDQLNSPAELSMCAVAGCRLCGARITVRQARRGGVSLSAARCDLAWCGSKGTP